MQNKRLAHLLAVGLALLDQLVIAILRHGQWITLHSQIHLWFAAVPLGLTLVVAIFLAQVIGGRARYSWGFILIFAGILSNTFSYILYGAVLDYITLSSFYTNPADLLVITGCILLGLQVIKKIRVKL